MARFNWKSWLALGGAALPSSFIAGYILNRDEIGAIEGTNSLIFSCFAFGFEFLIVACLPAVFVALLMLVWRRTRVSGLGIAAVWTLFYFGFFYFGSSEVFESYSSHQMTALEKCARSGKPLIAAIEAYKEDHGSAPRKLTDLAPDYLENIPGTGVAGWPEFEYIDSELAGKIYEGNPWALVVDTGTHIMDLSEFIYLPNQNYEAAHLGSHGELIGDWGFNPD